MAQFRQVLSPGTACRAPTDAYAFFVSSRRPSTHVETCGADVIFYPRPFRRTYAARHAAPPAPYPLAIRAAPLHPASRAAIPEIRARCTNSVPALRPRDCESPRVAHASQLLKWRRLRDLHLPVKLLLPARKGFHQEKRSGCGFLCANACGFPSAFLYLLFFLSMN